MRGPAMNTLANHGYISRNGITSFEEIILGTEEAFNLNRDMASAMAAINMVRIHLSTKAHAGKSLREQISIGRVSSFVPPLPGQIDGPETQGIAKHGRFEGDASMTRSDIHIGDNRNFNQTLWDMDLEQLAKFGDDGPDGPATVFNVQTLIELFAIPIRRLNLVFGTKNQATKRIITSFFMNQTFPENWFHAAAPVLGSPIPGENCGSIAPVVPGHNDENGVFVADPQPPAPFNISSVRCTNYWDNLVNAVPGTLTDITGIFKQNVDMLTGILFNGSGCSEPIAPAGPTNV
ncbi:hypothetical protein B0H14DRAFT_2768620 [Mycena olivaceomarginata]|nr:hypothetical protein B0H14DRAFT_2768620 [Mycena olivaceomarginata]